MVSAGLAWELAENTGVGSASGSAARSGRTSSVATAATSIPPGPACGDYVLAVKACLAAFRGDGPPRPRGPYYQLTLLPGQWAPRRHDHGDVKVDISAVGP